MRKSLIQREQRAANIIKMEPSLSHQERMDRFFRPATPASLLFQPLHSPSNVLQFPRLDRTTENRAAPQPPREPARIYWSEGLCTAPFSTHASASEVPPQQPLYNVSPQQSQEAHQDTVVEVFKILHQWARCMRDEDMQNIRRLAFLDPAYVVWRLSTLEADGIEKQEDFWRWVRDQSHQQTDLWRWAKEQSDRNREERPLDAREHRKTLEDTRQQDTTMTGVESDHEKEGRGTLCERTEDSESGWEVSEKEDNEKFLSRTPSYERRFTDSLAEEDHLVSYQDAYQEAASLRQPLLMSGPVQTPHQPSVSTSRLLGLGTYTGMYDINGEPMLSLSKIGRQQQREHEDEEEDGSGREESEHTMPARMTVS